MEDYNTPAAETPDSGIAAPKMPESGDPHSAESERHYAAFISYRHKPLDKEAAERIQKKIENYIVPKEFRDQVGGKKLGPVFRDEDELPASSSLTDSIYYALDHSRFLIVICTPDLPQSKWCEQEIRYFLKTHDRDHILAVLTDGSPEESFSPYLLHTFDEEGNITGDAEPLAANIAGDNHTINNKIFKKEVVRLLAALIGCPFDALWQRERRARTNRLLSLSGLALAIMAVFLVVVLNRNARIKEQNDRITEQNEKIEDQNTRLQTQLSSVLVDSGLTKLENFDVTGALEDGLAAIENDDPAVYDHRVPKLLAEALKAYQYQANSIEVVYEQSTDITQTALTDDGQNVIVKDRSGLIRCLDIDTFDVLWELPTNDDQTFFYVKDLDDRLIYHSGSGVYCHSLADGSLIWSREYSQDTNNYFRAISEDGGLFAIIEADGFSWGEENSVRLVILNTEDGSEAGQAELKSEGFSLELSALNEYYRYNGAFASDNSLFVCSLPSEKVLSDAELEAAIKDPSLIEEGRDSFFTVDLSTFEVTVLGQTLGHTCEYGIDIDPADRSVFFAGYIEGGGIHTGLFTRNGDDVEFSGELTAHSFPAPGGLGGILLNNFSDTETTFLSKDGRVYIFSDTKVFIYRRGENRLMQDFAMNGKVVNAGWVNKEFGILELSTSDGYVLKYHMNFDDNDPAIYKGITGGPVQTEVNRVLSVNRSKSHSDSEYLLAVQSSSPGRLLKITSGSDPHVSVYDSPGGENGYVDQVLTKAGSDTGFIFYLGGPEGSKAVTFNKLTGEMKQTAVLDSVPFHSNYYILDENSFIVDSDEFHMDGTSADYGEKIDLEHFYAALPYNHVLLSDGSLLSWGTNEYFNNQLNSEVPSGDDVYYVAVWIDGKLIGPVTDPAKEPSSDSSKDRSLDPASCLLLLRPEGSEYPKVTGGAGGLVMAFGQVVDIVDGTLVPQPEKSLAFMDVRSGEVTVMENACPASGNFMTAFTNNSHKMAAAYDDGTVCFYDVDAGTNRILEERYSPNEIFALAYDKNDEFFLVLTKMGRLDIYDAATLEPVFRDTPHILKNWSSEHDSADTSMNRVEAEKTSDGNYLFVTAGNVAYDYGILLDPDSRTVAAELDNVYCYDSDTNRVFCNGGQAIAVSYPIYSLADLKEWAAERLAGE